jgi:hypothetical protein
MNSNQPTSSYTVPPPRDPVACALSVYGNNATVACPCGKVIIARSMNAPGGGWWQCKCERRYKGWPENGQAISHILIWEANNHGASPSYCVTVEVKAQ